MKKRISLRDPAIDLMNPPAGRRLNDHNDLRPYKAMFSLLFGVMLGCSAAHMDGCSQK
jgi:hypothetical protein